VATLVVAIDASKAKRGAREFENAGRGIQTSARRTANALKQPRDAMNGFAASTTGAKAGAGALAASLKRLVAIVGGLAILRKTVRTIAEFQTAMATLQGVLRATSEEMMELEKTARRMGATTEFTAAQAAEGLLLLGRAGFETQETIAALPGVLDLATAGAIGLGEAADMTAKTLRQFGLQADQAGRVGSTLVATANLSNTNISQLGEALKMVGPLAAQVGMDLEETAAILGSLADRGLQASLAGTQLRGVLSILLEDTERNQKAFAKLGVEMSEVDPTTRSLTDIFRLLRARGMDAAAAVEIFGRRNAVAALILSGTVKSTKELEQAIRDMDEAAKENAELIRNTLQGDLNNLKSAFDELILASGDRGLAGALRGLVQGMTAFVRLIAGVDGAMKDASVATWLVVAAMTALTAVLVKLLAVKIVAGLVILKSTLLALATVAATAATALATLLGPALLVTASAAASLAVALSPLLVVVAALAVAFAAFNLGEWLYNDFPKVQTFFNEVVAILGKFKTDVVSTWEFMTRGLVLAMDKGLTAMAKAIDKFIGGNTFKKLRLGIAALGGPGSKELEQAVAGRGGMLSFLSGGAFKGVATEAEKEIDRLTKKVNALREAFKAGGRGAPDEQEVLRAEIELWDKRINRAKSFAELTDLIGAKNRAGRRLIDLNTRNIQKDVQNDIDARERAGETAGGFGEFLKNKFGGDSQIHFFLRDITGGLIDFVTEFENKIPKTVEGTEEMENALAKMREELKKLREEEDRNAQKAKMLGDVYKGVGNAVADTFERAVFEAQSAQDMLESMLRDISRIAFRIFVTNQLAGAIAGLAPTFGTTGGATTGGAPGGGDIQSPQTQLNTSASAARMVTGAVAPMTTAPAPVQVVQNITTPDANSFRRSKSQVARDARDVIRGTI